MAAPPLVLSYQGLLALLAGDAGLRARLLAGERLQAKTPLMYPGQLGPVIAYVGLAPAGSAEPADTGPAVLQATLDPSAEYVEKAPAPEPPPVEIPEVPMIRISDGGGLVKFLAEQGMELEVDMILSKTVFHAVREHEGAGIVGGQMHVDTAPESVGAGLWRFMQIAAEVMGLRHAKYKDALVQLERRRDAEADTLGWRPT
ncbi:MAG: hypothetical protein JXA87_09100 [Thermoleophilia bacterium]|nr:hypothetical protein [Thermoleophilia bacterium]